jgi:hypothetical protein
MKSFKERKNNIHFTISIYEEPSSKTLNLKEIRDYLNHKLGDIDIRLRRDFITFHLNSKKIDNIAEELARCKVRDITNPDIEINPLSGEVQFEKKLIKHPEKKLFGVIYDGYQLDGMFQNLIHNEELDYRNIHVVFTNRLFGTFDEDDGRYHARVILCGYPSIISTTGIVEAPAKPREFYHLKQKYQMLGMQIPPEMIKEKFQGKFIDYDDPRLTEVMKGYVMQSVFYHLTFKPFCEDKNCRLYNAHWQEEIINAQLKGGEFCVKHEHFFKEIKEQNKLSSNFVKNVNKFGGIVV